MIVTSDMMTKMIVTKIMMKTMTEMMTVIAVRSLAQVAGIYFEVSAIHQNFPRDDDDGDDDDEKDEVWTQGWSCSQKQQSLQN